MLMIMYLCAAMCVQYSLSEYLDIPQGCHRLPKTAQPKSYDLTLWMPRVWNNFTYDGHVVIGIFIKQDSNSITLNTDGLIIHENNTILLNNRNESVPILSQFFDAEKQFFVVKFNGILEVGDYSLSLSFIGEIRDDIFGFYRSVYREDNEEKWIAVTQFSPVFARRAFPCFDEPYLKATFKFRIGHYGNQTITSNTQREKSDRIDATNYFLTTMEQTPVMSTYLFGWAVHDLHYSHLPNSTSFGMWSRQSMIRKKSLALEQGLLIYSALELWMNMKNPIRKLEHVAVPDFNFHAMENWGMITFRETVVFLDRDVTPTKSIENGLSTMAHEYAHTWFGNLVTPEYWDVAWLKEGFATYFSYFIRSLVYPHMRFMDLFVVENLQDVFQDDAAEHNRTMNGRDSGIADNALGFLDFAAYKKGAAIVRMIQNIMGEESFKQALRSYLLTRSYNFATPSILYTHLRNYTEISGKLGIHIDIGEAIETYANEPGYPLVTITRNYSSNLIEISQERFNLDRNLNCAKSSGWWIPLNLASKSQRTSNVSEFGSIWLNPEEEKITINANFDSIDWVIGDVDKAGYYRINYDKSNWNFLILHLNAGGFNEINRVTRATLIDDSFNLARGGYIHYKIPFQLANYLQHETEYEPWFSAIKSFNFLIQILPDSPVLHRLLQEYIQRVTTPIYLSLTFNEIVEDQFHVKLLRNLILTSVCEMKNANCLKTATAIFQDWISKSSPGIKPNLKSIIYCEGIRASTSVEWEESFRIFLNAEAHIEKELLMSALGCTSNATLINKFLNFSISNNSPELPKQYRLTIVHNILNGNHENVYHSLNFISQNVGRIIQLRGHNFLNKVFNAIKNKITSTEKLRMLSSLVDNNSKRLGLSLKSAIDAIEYGKKTIAWIQQYSPIITDALEAAMQHSDQ